MGVQFRSIRLLQGVLLLNIVVTGLLLLHAQITPNYRSLQTSPSETGGPPHSRHPSLLSLDHDSSAASSRRLRNERASSCDQHFVYIPRTLLPALAHFAFSRDLELTPEICAPLRIDASSKQLIDESIRTLLTTFRNAQEIDTFDQTEREYTIKVAPSSSESIATLRANLETAISATGIDREAAAQLCLLLGNSGTLADYSMAKEIEVRYELDGTADASPHVRIQWKKYDANGQLHASDAFLLMESSDPAVIPSFLREYLDAAELQEALFLR